MTVMDYDGPLVVGVRSQDQAIVSFRPGDDAETLVVAVENASFGDLTPIAGQSALLATQETHSESGDVVRSIVRIDLDDHSVASLVTGRDFLAGGRSAPDGRQVAWCAWDHPSMPWDGSEVWSGFLSHAEGRWEIVDAVHVAGGVGNPACHPTFADDGALLFVFEADEWGIPWSREPAKGPKALLDDEADYGAPLWELGETELVGRRGRRWGLRRSGGLVSPVEIVSGSFVPWESSATLVNSIIPTDAGLAWIGSTSDRLAVVVRANDDGVEVARVELGGVPPLRPDEIARPETITVEGRDGERSTAFSSPRLGFLLIPKAAPLLWWCSVMVVLRLRPGQGSIPSSRPSRREDSRFSR